jgi:hypothetical protein
MRLVLEQQTWPEHELDAATRAELPHIALLQPTPWGEDVAVRRQQVVNWNLPPDATLEMTGEQLVKSSVGWPMRLIEAQVMRGNEVVEVRVCAFYVLLEYWAGAIWRGPLGTFTEKRDEIIAAVSGGRPDWRRREIIALFQLFESA